MKKLLVLASITAVVLFAAVIPAKAVVPYMLLQAGAGSPNSDDMEDDNIGFAGNVTFGVKFLPYLAGQLETGYIYNYNAGDHEPKFAAIPLATAIRLIIPAGIVEPYFIFGGGAYFTDTKLERENGSTVYDVNSTEFGVFGGGGVNFHIKEVIVGLEFRYLALDADRIDASAFQYFANLGFTF